MLANWHMPISVIPGKADARHCSIKARGAAASTVRVPVVGQPLACILSTADAHGNVRHSGGATVSPVVIRPDGEETSKAKACPSLPLSAPLLTPPPPPTFLPSLACAF